MFPVKLKNVFDKAVKDSIEQIPATSLAFKEKELDLKAHIDNEMDFYLGVVIATIFEKYGSLCIDGGIYKTTNNEYKSSCCKYYISNCTNIKREY